MNFDEKVEKDWLKVRKIRATSRGENDIISEYL
jgi:uncharacterized protein (UPF0335 family)